MNTKEIIESIEIIQKLKTGNYNVLSQDEKYNLSVEKLQDDKILKFFARNLKNGEALSGDFYKVR
jgi:predicted secreted protein